MMKDRDIGLWLSTKLEESWSSEKIAPFLNNEMLHSILKKFPDLEMILKIRVLFSLLVIKKKDFPEMKDNVLQLFQLGLKDEDEWVRIIAELLQCWYIQSKFQTKLNNYNNNDQNKNNYNNNNQKNYNNNYNENEDEEIIDCFKKLSLNNEDFQNTFQSLQKVLEEKGEPNFFPLDFPYLSPRLLDPNLNERASVNPHFQLKKPPSLRFQQKVQPPKKEVKPIIPKRNEYNISSNFQKTKNEMSLNYERKPTTPLSEKRNIPIEQQTIQQRIQNQMQKQKQTQNNIRRGPALLDETELLLLQSQHSKESLKKKIETEREKKKREKEESKKQKEDDRKRKKEEKEKEKEEKKREKEEKKKQKEEAKLKQQEQRALKKSKAEQEGPSYNPMDQQFSANFSEYSQNFQNFSNPENQNLPTSNPSNFPSHSFPQTSNPFSNIISHQFSNFQNQFPNQYAHNFENNTNNDDNNQVVEELPLPSYDEVEKIALEKHPSIFEKTNALTPEGREEIYYFLAGFVAKGCGDVESKKIQLASEEVSMDNLKYEVSYFLDLKYSDHSWKKIKRKKSKNHNQNDPNNDNNTNQNDPNNDNNTNQNDPNNDNNTNQNDPNNDNNTNQNDPNNDNNTDQNNNKTNDNENENLKESSKKIDIENNNNQNDNNNDNNANQNDPNNDNNTDQNNNKINENENLKDIMTQ